MLPLTSSTRRCVSEQERRLDKKLEMIVLPVSDVDRAKAFYLSAGLREDLDYTSGVDFRVIRLTPPGSRTSILFGIGVTAAAPGSVEGLHLTVADIEEARDELLEQGIDVGGVFHDVGGVFHHASPGFHVPGLDPAGRAFASFARFADPDGNGWVLHEARDRPPRSLRQPLRAEGGGGHLS
jgi:catechol 2,3-dioxygenase-like lactoylglutathione lyase family enzyme